MNMKDTVAVLIIVVVAVVFDTVMDSAGVPVTFLDVLMVGICLLILYVPVSAFFIKHKPTKKTAPQGLAKPEWGKLIFGLALVLALSGLSFYLGLDDPWKLYKGVRGPAHGYTMLLLGSALAVIGLMLGYWMLLLLIETFKNSRSDK